MAGVSRLFISHASANNAQALALALWLADNGWRNDYFLDISPSGGLLPGERWQAALKAAADRCEAVLFLLSPGWLASPWSRAEFLLAKQLNKAVFGVLIETVQLDDLPREMTGEWQLCDLVAGTERSDFEVAQDPIVPKTVVSFGSAGLTRLRHGLQRAGLDPATFAWPPPSDPKRAPYRGLRALEAEDAGVFFGREAVIVRGLDTLRGLREHGGARLLVVLGASGAGKSSFLRAGLLPRLARDDRNFVLLPVIRPERAAITGSTGLASSLEAAFRRYDASRSRADIHEGLTSAARLDCLLGELQALGQVRLVDPEAPPLTVVIPVDQGEELYGAEGRAEADAFLALLGRTLVPPAGGGAEALAAPGRALCVMAFRSESYERLQTDTKLARVTRLPFDLPPIAHSEFKAVIEKPAERATIAGRRLTVQPTLTERLLKDADGADALPLLAFTLERLFVEYGGDGDLRLDEYEKLGGVRGSIEAAVEAAFADPGRVPAVPAGAAERERLLHKGFVPWLVRVDPDSDERKRRLALWEKIPADARPLLERLIEQRLLVRDHRRVDGQEGDAVVVEVAHEALLRQWSSLARWLDEDAAELKTLDTVRRAADEWVKNGKGVAWLVHTGDRLDQAERLWQRSDFHRLLGTKGAGYLQACRQRDDAGRAERDTQQRQVASMQRTIGFSLLVVTVALTGAAALLIREARAVGRQTSLVLADAAGRASDDRALRLAVLAARDTWLSPAALEAQTRLATAAHASGPAVSLTGHEDRIWAAVFSPDGQRVVTASADKTARVWDAATGKALATLAGHEDTVNQASFSPDGRRVVTASQDKTARVWDGDTGRVLATLTGHEAPVIAASFSPDGRRVVTASQDKTARMWDGDTGRVLATLTGHEAPVIAASFSPDGRRVVTASWDKTARVWDAATGQMLATLRGHDAPVVAASFGPDGQRVVTASRDHTARVWDAATGNALATLTGHEDGVVAASFSPDAMRVVTASWDKTARLWDAATGQMLATLRGHEGGVGAARFSPDGRRVVTASRDHTARVWDAATGNALATLTGHEDGVVAASFSPDGMRVVTASLDKTARVWQPPMGKVLITLTGHEDGVRAASFSADGQRVVTASADKTARVWDARNGHALATLTGHGGRVWAASFSADGQRVVTASADKTARVWDAATGQALATLAGHGDTVWAAVFSPDGQRVVTASADKTARVWDAATGQALATLGGHEGSVWAAVFSPDGQRVVTASADKTARVWDVDTGQALATLTGHEAGVWAVSFSPDSRRIVTASWDTTARVWDAATGQTHAILTGHRAGVGATSFSPDGRRVVTASRDKTARVWDAETGATLATLTGHEDGVCAASFSADGQRVVTASRDKTARVWDAETGATLATLTGHEDIVWAASFSDDGVHIVTGSKDKTARVWDVRWLTQYHGKDLVTAVCTQKLVGVSRRLTDDDILAAPILRGHKGEDVCAR
jgi:WD40 repeat protein